MVQGLNTGGGNIFFSSTKPRDRSQGPHSLLLNEYRAPLPGVKRQRREVNHWPLSNTDVNNTDSERKALFCGAFE